MVLMNDIRTMYKQVPVSGGGLRFSLVVSLSAIAGLAVANLYYAQPMLAAMGGSLGATSGALGLIPMLTQLGYALGILLLAPLGDRIDRRRLVLLKLVALGLALSLSAFAPDLGTLMVSSLLTGLAATLAQDVVSAAASMAPSAQRGRVVGSVMTGLLLGILVSRVLSGFVAAQWGWRAMFGVAAFSIAGALVLASLVLPSLAPTTSLPYVQLLRSLGSLWRQQPALRRAALAQGLLSVGFSAFWSTLSLLLNAAPFHLGSAAAGSFGLVGALGAIAAPLAGRLADRRGSVFVSRIGTGLTLVSFALLFLAPRLTTHGQLWLLALSALGFDLGVQVSLISHQTIVYALEPAARSRLNAILFVSMFVGMAAGSGLGALLFARLGWSAVAALASVSAAAAFLLRLGALQGSGSVQTRPTLSGSAAECRPS